MSDIDCPLTYVHYVDNTSDEFAILCIEEKCAWWCKSPIAACSIKVDAMQTFAIANTLNKIEKHLAQIEKGVYR